MEKITLEEIKSIELKLLLEFDYICQSNSFRYSLAGGTLLGAVRHKGFIPWDDDIDVIMPRPDYNKFIEHCKENFCDFQLLSNSTLDTYPYLYSKISDNKTILIEKVTDQNKENRGVYIDIFPVDGLGSSIKDAINNFKRTSLKRELLVASLWKKWFRSKTRAWYVEPVRFILFCISRLANPMTLLRSVDLEIQRLDFDSSDYCGCVCGAYREKEIMPREVFTEVMDMEFEGHMFKATKHYDKYLTQLYGDYMRLPPVEKRQTHHTFEAYWKD